MAASLQTKMERILQDLKDYYTKLVRNNPDTVSQIESAVRILSFLVAGRFENGELLSELIYAASNLLIFLHDNIFKAATKYIQNLEVSKVLVQRWLTVIEYLEVFVEMAARKKWGEYGAWIFISVIQITKTVLRLVLLLRMGAGIQTTPPIGPVDREVLKAAMEEHDSLEDAWDELNAKTSQEKTFTLPSSGRQIRTLQAASYNGTRTWSIPNAGDPNPQNGMLKLKQRLQSQPPSVLTKHRLMAEILHIAKPLTHLLAMYVCGQSSWKPWCVALGMDLSSLKLMGEPKELNSREKAEMKRRTIMLLYYLMRSPFYNNYTKAKIVSTLGFIAAHVPLSGLVLRPVLDYLPTWQKMYFYAWAT